MNTTLKGNLFEERAYDIIAAAVNEGQLGLISENCKVFRKKAYFSKERDSNIIFDLSIEVWLPNAEQYHLLYLIECKDYTNHSVPVNDLEEFVSHIQQVTGENAKGVFITTNVLQQGALNYARSRGLMLIEVDAQNKSKIVLHNKNRRESILTDEAVATWEQQAERLAEISNIYDDDSGLEINWDDAIRDFISKQLNTDIHWEQPGTKVMGLERLSKNLIEEMTTNIIKDFDASILSEFKGFPMDEFLIYLKDKYGLTVITDQEIPVIKGKKLNGYCDLENKRIFIDVSLRDTGQYVFVCAHEIAHFFLHMNVHIPQTLYNNLNDSAYDPAIGKYALLNEKHWLEWQANQFAAALIMPLRCVLGKLIIWQKKAGISRLGRVWLDHQPCNVRDFKVMITILAYEFLVSRPILEYRMADLQIITYAYGKGYNRYSLFGNIKKPQSIGQILDKMVFDGGNED